MAAILCQGIGKGCNSICNCISAVCRAPFQLCGMACEGCANGCQETCKLIGNCCSSPFCCYITVATVLNLPPLISGLMDSPNLANASDCGMGSWWLLGMWIFSLIHIVAAFYMSVAIQRDDSILPNGGENDTTNGGDVENQERGSAGDVGHRMKQLFCYDSWMAVYILVLLAYFAWMFVGIVWFITGSMEEDGDDDAVAACDDDLIARVSTAFAFGWAFIFFGGCALIGSMCCTVFHPRRSRPGRHQGTSQQQQDSSMGGNNGANNASKHRPQPSAPSQEEVPMAEATIVPETGLEEKNKNNQTNQNK